MLDYKDLDDEVRMQLHRIATRLEEREQHLVDVQWEAHGMFPTYDQVPKNDLRRSALRNVRRVIAALRGEVERLDPDAETESEYLVGRRRAQQGVPAEDLVECYRQAIARILDSYITEADAQGLNTAATLAGMRLLWAVSDMVPNAYLAGHKDVALDDIRSEESRRASFVIELLTDSGAAVDRLAFGISPADSYWLLRLPLQTGRPLDVERELWAMGAMGGFQPLTAHYDGDLVAIVAHRPSVDTLPSLSSGVAAIDGPQPAQSLHTCYATAGTVLRCAERFGLRGIVDRSELSVLLAVSAYEDVGELLYTRLILPISSTRTGDEILCTVAEFLVRHCSVAETSKALDIHQNSVRYRLTRYAELTGVDITNTDTLVEIWWAFKFRELRSRQRLDNLS